MTTCPQIVAYKLLPETQIQWRGKLACDGFIARFWQGGDFLPMIFSGQTSDAAITAARSFWQSETAKIEARRAHAAEMGKGRSKRAAANVGEPTCS